MNPWAYVIIIWVSGLICHLRSRDPWVNMAATAIAISVGGLLVSIHLL